MSLASIARRRIAFVIQRYGSGFSGGSESHCSAVAERLAADHHVEVLTTCADDNLSWTNAFEPGLSESGGVTIRRFSVDRPRDTRRFDELHAKVFSPGLTREEEHDLIRAQGPDCPALVSFIESQQDNYDVFIFFTYLYYPLVEAMPRVSGKAIFVPTAHDEPLLYLRLFDPVFHSTPHLLFNTEEEQYLVRRRFHLPTGTGCIAGLGVERKAEPSSDPGWDALERRLAGKSVLTYLGRVETGKGCDELFDYFTRFCVEVPQPDLVLLMLGSLRTTLPLSEQVIAPGFVSGAFVNRALERTDIAIAPSRYESLCLALLESWLEGKPALVNGSSDVLRGQCIRANAGLWYTDYFEFREALLWLLNHRHEAKQMGLNGQRYVQERYSWPAILSTYSQAIEDVCEKRIG